MPPPLPRCSGWAYSSLISPSRVSLPRKGRRVGLHIDIFEACSAFTRVAACTLALSPIRDTLIEGFSHFVTSMTAPIASGWSESPGGACTHWKAPPCHGAPPKRPFARPEMRGTAKAKSVNARRRVFDALATLLAGTPGPPLGVPGGRNRRLGALLGGGSERLRRRGRAVLPEEPPVTNIGEMDPVCRGKRPVRMRKVAVQDQLVCCLSAVTELGPVHIAVGEQAVEPVR